MAALPTTPETFRRWLRSLRERAGLSQDDLAIAIGDASGRRNIHRWESAGREPGALTLLKLLDATGVKLTPAPPGELPRSVNAEVRELVDQVQLLREDVNALRALVGERADQVLGELRERVA